MERSRAEAGWLRRRRAMRRSATEAAAEAAELAVRRQAALLSAVMDSISDGVAVVDEHGGYLVFNRAARDLLGVDSERPAAAWERAGKILRADGVTVLPAVDMPSARALRGISSDDVPLVIQQPGHPEPVYVAVSARPLDRVAGVEVSGSVSVFHDVTAARVLQEALQSEHDRYRQLLEVLSDLGEGVIITQDRETLFVNDAYAGLTGYPADELLAGVVDVLAADEVALEQFVRWRQNLEEFPGTPATMVTRIRRRDGRIVPVETVGVSVGSGPTRRRVSVNRDLTEWTRVRLELEHRAAALVALNARMQVANRELGVARDLADAASRAKSAFLATVSHEIRTPLNAIVGLTDLLLGSDLTPRQRDHLDTVRSSGDHLTSLINDILDWTTIESGILELEHQRFNLRDCVDAAATSVAAQVGGKDLDLLVEVHQDCPDTVIGDRIRVQQILVHLLSNAVKFTAGGSVLLTATVNSGRDEAAATSRTGSAVGEVALRFSMTDTGIGIAASDVDRLFRDFSQIDDSTSRVYGGTGLGLAISQRLARAMGGAITVTSQSGVGSTFTAELRLTTADPVPGQSTVAAPSGLTGRRVLIVDDNPVGRRTLSAQLADWGMRCDVAASGSEALDALAARSYDLAVIDRRMPHMDGLTLLDTMSTRPATARLPVIMLSSVADHTTVTVAAGHRATGLARPVRAVDLADALTALLDSGPAAGAAPQPQPPTGSLPTPVGPSRPGLATIDADLRVLLVEDNPVNLRVAQLILDRLGYAADSAVNGHEAVEYAQHTPYDVILMDVQMPVMDGLAATRHLRQHPPTGGRPWIVAVTANALGDAREQCAAAGMDDYLAKPLRRDDLAALLKTIERQKSAAQ